MAQSGAINMLGPRQAGSRPPFTFEGIDQVPQGGQMSTGKVGDVDKSRTTVPSSSASACDAVDSGYAAKAAVR